MIYLLDRYEKLLAIVPETDLSEFVYQVELNRFDEAFFVLEQEAYLDALKQTQYFGFFHKEDFKVFRIVDSQSSDNRYIKGIDRAESDLRTVVVIKDKRPQNVTADQALTVALEETGYQVGHVEGLPTVDSTSFYYISPLEALVKVVEKWQCEFRVRYTFVENSITGRYIDLYHKQGRVTGKQFIYGDNLLSVVHEESSDEVITALIGRGKGEELDSGGYGRRIEFTDVIWSKRAGKPINKPAGQNYVVDDMARMRYGLSQNGQLKHRWGVFIDEEIDDPERLLERTYEELQRLSVPLTVFKAKILSLGEDVWLGDTVAIIRDNVRIAFEARVQRITIDMLSFERSDVILGDYQTLRNQSERSANQRLKQAIDDQMSRYAQDLQAFYGRIEAEKNRRNAEIDEHFRLAQLDFDNYKVLAETKVEEVKSEITDKIDTQLKPLAVEAKTLADRAVSDLERQGQELERTKAELGTVRRSAESAIQTAQRVKTEAITASNQQLDEAKRTLSSQIQTTQGQIADAKRELQVYAQIRQNDVDTRLTTVQELADGTKTRVLELKTTVDQTTGKVQAVERRTKTVEDGLTGLTRRFEAVRVGGRNYFLNSSLSTASPYTKLTIHPDFEKHVKGKSFIISVEVEGTDITGSNRGRFGISLSVRRGNTSVRDYLEVWETGTGTVAKKRLFKAFDWREDWTDLNAGLYIQTDGHLTVGYPMLEISDVPSDYRPAEEDFRSEFATYKQGIDQNLAELTRTTQTIGGKVETYKTTFEQTAERFRQTLTTLETYKNDEAARASRYFEASKTETAKQLTAMRQAISNDYVAKSTYEENSREVIRRFEGLSIGSNLVRQSKINESSNLYGFGVRHIPLTRGRPYWFLARAKKTGGTDKSAKIYLHHPQWRHGSKILSFDSEAYEVKAIKFIAEETTDYQIKSYWYPNGGNRSGTADIDWYMVVEGELKPTEWQPHPEDGETRLAEYKQSIDGQLSTMTQQLADKVSRSTLNQTADDIKGLVSTLDGQVMKSSQFRIDENGLVLQAGRTFDGTTIASLLTVNDDHIKAITNQMIITPTQQNLVQSAYRESLVVAARDTQVSEWYTFDAKGGDQFYFEAEVTRLDVTGNYDLKAMVTTIYKEGGYDATRVVLAQRTNPHNQKMVCQATVTLPNRPKTIVKFRIGLQEETHASFTRYRVDNLRVYKKTSAALLVDGTITGRHIMAGSIEAGHIKAGSITAELIDADTIKAKHLVVDQALIDKLFVDDLITRTLTAREAFITSVQAIDLSAERIKSGILASRNGAMTVNLDTGELLFFTDKPALKRVIPGYPPQFIKFSTGHVKEGSTFTKTGVTMIGSNRHGTEDANDDGFVGIRAWNGTNMDAVDVVGDEIRLVSSAFQQSKGWRIRTTEQTLSMESLMTSDRLRSEISAGNFWIWKTDTEMVSLKDCLNTIADNLEQLHKAKMSSRSYTYKQPFKF